MTTTLLHGDCREVLPTLPAGSVQMCVTSPPYWGLRDYGVAGQLGLEQTPDEYIERMVGVFREVKRVLRNDGTLWLNIGDSYAQGGNGPGSEHYRNNAIGAVTAAALALPPKKAPAGLKPKDLVGIPWMLAFALRADGWYLRCDIVWHKPNPMPESVTDRPTKAHEYLFLLSKSERYYYDAEAIREQSAPSSQDRAHLNATAKPPPRSYQLVENGAHKGVLSRAKAYGQGRNRRSVWTVSTTPYKDAHFATFPEQLVEPCILAGSGPRACEVCGAAWERVVEKETHFEGGSGKAGRSAEDANANGKWAGQQYGKNIKLGPVNSTVTTGWRQACNCSSNGTGRSIVLDPFAGSGTTLRVAERLGRDSIGIELNADYIKLQEKRTDGVQRMMAELL